MGFCEQVLCFSGELLMKTAFISMLQNRRKLGESLTHAEIRINSLNEEEQRTVKEILNTTKSS